MKEVLNRIIICKYGVFLKQETPSNYATVALAQLSFYLK